VNPTDYIWIARWNEFLGYSYITEEQQRRAAEEGAPVDAIFKDRQTDRWVRIGEVKNEATRSYFMDKFSICRAEGFWDE